MRIVYLGIVILGLLATVAGCRLTSGPPSTATVPPGVEEAPADSASAELVALLKDHNLTIEQLREDLRRMAAQEEDPAGARALQEDVRVAKALVGAARRAAADKTPDPARTALERLLPALVTLRGSLPAARLTQHLERALQTISSMPAEESMPVASRFLLQATDLAMKAPATLVPTVLRDIEGAKDQVDKQNLSAASNSLLNIVKKLGEEESLRSADRALGAARGAQEALDQEAWVVLTAQLDYLDSLLSSLQQKVEGAITPLTPTPAPETPAAPEAPPAAPAAPAPGMPAPGAPAAPPAAPAWPG